MPPTTDKEPWVGVQEASRIISANSGHHVSPDQVRQKAASGKITTHSVPGKGAGGFKKMYKRADVEGIVVKQHDFPRRVTEPTD